MPLTCSPYKLGGGIGKIELHKFDDDINVLCDYCGTEVGTVEHIIFDCCFFQSTRDAVGDKVCMVRSKHLPPALRKGIAPVL